MTQNLRKIELEGRQILLLGTAHVSRESVEEVAQAIREEKPDVVCVELDEARLATLKNNKGWQELDITKVLKEGKGFLLLANLVLSSFQRRIGTDTGSKPGDEMKKALEVAEEEGIRTAMVDRPIHVTLKRAWSKNSFIGKVKLLAALTGSAFTSEELTEADIEALKNKGAMEEMMNELADYLPTVKEVLIDERDRYLASRIWSAGGTKSLAVLGAGHLAGTEALIRKIAAGSASADTSDIETVIKPGFFSRAAGWLLPALIVALIAAGFFTGGAMSSMEMLGRWLLWNGSLAALGTLVALGHPLAILTAFVGAPVATINPFIGVGLFSGLAQAWIKKPRVSDMENLAQDVTHIKGFYRNRISHVLLIFFLSSLGGAIGNFIAVPALVGSLVK